MAPAPFLPARARPVWQEGLLIFGVAFILRGGFLLAAPDRAWPHSTLYEGDAPLWARFSQAVGSGQAFELDLPIHPPGMAYLLLPWASAAPARFFIAKLLCSLIGSLNCALIVLIAAPHVGQSVARAAGLLSAASFGLLVQSTSLNSETPYTCVLLLCVALVQRLASRPSLLPCIALGCLNGAAALLRPEHLLFAVFAVTYLLFCWRRIRPALRTRDLAGSAARAACIVAVTLLSLSPWTFRNYRAIQRFNEVEPLPVDLETAGIPWDPQAAERIRSLPAFARDGNVRYITHLARERNLNTVTPDFVDWFFSRHMGYWPRPLNPLCLVSMQGPLSFALANNDLADGGFSTRLLDDQAAAQLIPGNPRHLRLIQDGYRVGWDWVCENPRAALSLLGRKIWIFSQGLASSFTAWNLPVGLSGLRRPVDQWTADPSSTLSIVWTTLILAVGLFGMLASRGTPLIGCLMLVILYKLLITLAFYGYARQAVSILPIWYVFVACGAGRLVSRVRRRTNETSKGHNPHRASPGRRVRFVLPAACVALIVSAAISAFESRRYDVEGPIDRAPEWGPTAFESHQPLWIRRL